MIRFAIFSFLVLISGVTSNVLSAQSVTKPSIPVSFIQNQGQWSPEVRFMAQTPGMTVWLTNKGLMYDVLRVSLRSDALNGQDDIPALMSALAPARPLRASLGSDTLIRTNLVGFLS